MRVLAVDDDEDIRASLDLAWEGEGFELEMVEDGDQALQAIQRQKPAVLITDFRMPGMDGIELIKRVKSEHDGVFTILMTAYPNPSLPDQARAAGCDMFLPKPFDPDDVLEQIRGLVSDQ